MKRDPKYRKHSTRDRAFVEVEGRRIYLPGNHNSDESRAAYKALCADLRGKRRTVVPRVAPQSKILVYEVVSQYLAKLAPPTAGERCEADNMRESVVPLLKHYGTMHAADFGPKTLKALQRTLAETRKKPPKNDPLRVMPTLSVASVNSIIGRIKTVFRWAVSEELVPASLYHGLETVRQLKPGQSAASDPKEKPPVLISHVAAVMRHVPPVVASMLRLQFYTGARSRSICLAKPEQFNTNVEPWLWRPRHKTERRRKELIIPIGPRARRLLVKLLADTQPGEYLFRPRSVRNDARYRDRYDSRSYGHAVARGIQKANKSRKPDDQIQSWSPHRLRHSLGQAASDRFGYEGVQAMLGHDSVQASKIYGGQRLALAKKIASEIG